MATISSHTLNGSDGTHAGGIKVKLIQLDTHSVLFESAMDNGGRLSETVDPLLIDPKARYELVFDTGSYWEHKPDSIPEIALRFLMPDPTARYHLPLIISPNSYSTWASAPEQ